MTDTPRRRAPLPTSEGTLKLKPRTAAPATKGTRWRTQAALIVWRVA